MKKSLVLETNEATVRQIENLSGQKFVPVEITVDKSAIHAEQKADLKRKTIKVRPSLLP